MLLTLFYLPVRLLELNFEVKVYENYKQGEVLDKICEGLHLSRQFDRNGKSFLSMLYKRPFTVKTFNKKMSGMCALDQKFGHLLLVAKLG